MRNKLDRAYDGPAQARLEPNNHTNHTTKRGKMILLIIYNDGTRAYTSPSTAGALDYIVENYQDIREVVKVPRLASPEPVGVVPWSQPFGAELKRLRKSLGITQAELAKRAKQATNQSFYCRLVSMFENGQQAPTGIQLAGLCAALELEEAEVENLTNLVFDAQTSPGGDQ